MFPYRVKYTESEYDIQNNNSLYKIHQQCQNTFELWDFLKFKKKKFNVFIFCDHSLSTWHIPQTSVHVSFLAITTVKFKTSTISLESLSIEGCFSDVIPFRGMLQRRKGTV